MLVRAQRSRSHGTLGRELGFQQQRRFFVAGVPLRVALVGPPNAGKSTLFNQLTGLRQRVANYPGVTVERHSGVTSVGGEPVEVIDLPGIHGLSPRSPDQTVTRNVLLGMMEDGRPPDAVVLVVDATRLETHLMIAEPVLALGLPTLVVLTMADELDERGGRLDMAGLSEKLGVEAALVNARNATSLSPVRDFLAGLLATSPEARECPVVAAVEPSDRQGRPLPLVDQFKARRQRVQGIGRAAAFRPPAPSKATRRIDAFVLHRVWGPIVFLAVVVVVFQAIFKGAVPLIDGTEAVVAGAGAFIASVLPDTWFRSLLIDGIWAGVGSVVVFLPQILTLFLFIAIMEDSGYMVRAAVVADRLMQRAGLQGQSFLPLLSGYACAVPAIMAARTVEDERDRIATIFVTPFMTCSARLPVYALLIAAFIPEGPLLGPFLGQRAGALLGLYALGLFGAVLTAFLLKRSLLRNPAAAFVMELPPYRWPTLRSVGARLAGRAKVFLLRVGKIIMTVSIVLWMLARFPAGPDGAAPAIEDSALGAVGRFIEPAVEPLGFDWRIGIGLVTSLAAREVIVGTLGTIYGVESADESSLELQAALQGSLDVGAAVALLVFFAFALQCMSTVAVMKRETGGWRWPALQFGYMLALACAGAWAANMLL